MLFFYLFFLPCFFGSQCTSRNKNSDGWRVVRWTQVISRPACCCLSPGSIFVVGYKLIPSAEESPSPLLSVGVVIPNHARWLILPRIWDGINQAKKKERFNVCCIFLRLSTFKVSYSSLPSFHPGACACRQVGWRSFCGTLSVVCVLSCTRHGHLQSKEKKYAHFPYMHHLFFLLILRISTSFENKVDSLYVKDNNNNDSVGKKQGSHLLWREKKKKKNCLNNAWATCVGRGGRKRSDYTRDSPSLSFFFLTFVKFSVLFFVCLWFFHGLEGFSFI